MIVIGFIAGAILLVVFILCACHVAGDADDAMDLRERNVCDGALLYVEDYIYAADKREPDPWAKMPSSINVWGATV